MAVFRCRHFAGEIILWAVRWYRRYGLSLRLNKMDANDAEGLAQIVRTGWCRQVQVKSLDSHLIRTVLAARTGLVAIDIIIGIV